MDRRTQTRIRYNKTNERGEPVKQEDIVKAYEYEKGKYVTFTDDDFEKIKTPRDKSITVERFVALSEIDPIYFDKAYYVMPNGGERAFALLLSVMESEQKAAVAKTVLGKKETLVALRCVDGRMLANTLFFADEIVDNPVNAVKCAVTDAELATAKAIVESMCAAFDPEMYKDEYNERVKEAIENKIVGKKLTAPNAQKEENISDLMEALQLTLRQTNAAKQEDNDKRKGKGARKKSENSVSKTTSKRDTKKVAPPQIKRARQRSGNDSPSANA